MGESRFLEAGQEPVRPIRALEEEEEDEQMVSAWCCANCYAEYGTIIRVKEGWKHCKNCGESMQGPEARIQWEEDEEGAQCEEEEDEELECHECPADPEAPATPELRGDETPRAVEQSLSQGEVADTQQQDDRKEGEEGRRPRVLKDVVRVSKKEREEHEATHTPYRPWCRHCVRARARNEPHCKRKKEDEDTAKIPRVSFDYFFMSQEDERAN